MPSNQPPDRVPVPMTPDQMRVADGSAPSGQGREAGFFVVLGRQSSLPEEAALRTFAEAFKLDAYSARQRLMTPGPRVLRREAREGEAERWRLWLRELGMAAFVMRETELSGVPPVQVATLVMENSQIMFVDPAGEAVRVAHSELLCLVSGAVHARRIRESMARDMIVGNVGLSHEVLHSEANWVADLHVPSRPRVFRLQQGDLRVGDASVVTAKDFHELLSSIQKAAPAMQVFADFDKASGALGQSWAILSQHQEAKGPMDRATGAPRAHLQTHQVIQRSEAEAFDLYSLLTRLQLLRA